MLKRYVDETKLPKMECQECGLTSEPVLGSGKIVSVIAEDEKGNHHRVGEQIRAKYVCPVKHTMIEEFDI